MRQNDDGDWEFIPNEGPKRGIYIGNAGVYSPEVYHPNAGPRRGVGPYPFLEPAAAGSDEQRCLDLVNDFRRSEGKPNLSYSKRLTEIAMPHSVAMLERRVPVGHAGFQERAAQVGMASATGENVAFVGGMSDPVKQMVNGWINSLGHRRNLLGDFNQMGIAFARKGDLWYGTQFFALI
jgi:uncharacterized protein YkwD